MTSPLWKKTRTVGELNALCQDTIHSALGIEFTEVGDAYLVAEMPVDSRTKQPFGILHGGASVVLAESLGSMASFLALVDDTQISVGIEVNANHLKSARSGKVTGRVTPIHIGRALHVWEIKIADSAGNPTCQARLTVLVRESKASTT